VLGSVAVGVGGTLVGAGAAHDFALLLRVAVGVGGGSGGNGGTGR
jgi:hypothetical protein